MRHACSTRNNPGFEWDLIVTSSTYVDFEALQMQLKRKKLRQIYKFTFLLIYLQILNLLFCDAVASSKNVRVFSNDVILVPSSRRKEFCSSVRHCHGRHDVMSCPAMQRMLPISHTNNVWIACLCVIQHVTRSKMT